MELPSPLPADGIGKVSKIKNEKQRSGQCTEALWCQDEGDAKRCWSGGNADKSGRQRENGQTAHAEKVLMDSRSSKRNMEVLKQAQLLRVKNGRIKRSVLIYMSNILCIHMWCRSPFSTALHLFAHVPHYQCSQSCSDGSQVF